MKRFIKLIVFSITFFAACVNNASTLDILEDSSTPVNSILDYSWQKDEDEDFISLRLGNIKDIKKPRSIKYLEIDDDLMINKFKGASGLLKNNLNQNLEKNGVAETTLDLVFSSENTNLNSDNSIQIYKYRNKALALKFSQLIPFNGAELVKFNDLEKRDSFLISIYIYLNQR